MDWAGSRNDASVQVWLRQDGQFATYRLPHPSRFNCDRDAKWSSAVRQLLSEGGIRVVQTPWRAPNANAHAERFVRSIKQESLDRVIPLGEQAPVYPATGHYGNQGRPHASLGPGIPEHAVCGGAAALEWPSNPRRQRVVAIPILAGPHHVYGLDRKPRDLNTAINILHSKLSNVRDESSA